jgi:hypothetical protein
MNLAHLTDLMRADTRRLRRQCDANPPGLRLDLLRALRLIRPGEAK